ncbi:MAG: hypothetical protein AMJ78_07525 [Omnitrophica WOR_2 bacterium SM23_29]|nr:MAG: hypothetical protein AMJ78_07525 [Omnitrophica WOR_2 bacterium SM23_29]
MKSRLPIILLSLLCIVFLLVAIQQFLGRQQANKARLISERSLRETIQAKEALQNELEEQRRVRADLESQFASIKGQFTSLQSQAEELAAALADEKRAKEEALNKFDEKLHEAETLRVSLESERKEKIALQEQFDKIRKEYVSIQDQLKTVKAQNESLARQIQELEVKKEVELEKIVVKPGSGQEGKVLVVNKDFNFIVIGAGNNKGITPGVVFGVYRDGNLIGKAQVEKVYETMSAANILPDSKQIKEGDLAKAL